MGKTVSELTRSLDSAEITEWLGFTRIEPLPGPRGDTQAGIIASTLYNLHVTDTDKLRPPADFMPRYGAADSDADEPAPERGAEWRKEQDRIANEAKSFFFAHVAKGRVRMTTADDRAREGTP